MYEALYNITSFSNFLITVNNLSFGLFGYFILFGFALVFFRTAQSRMEVLDALNYTLVFTTFISLFLTVINLIDINVTVLLAVSSAIALAYNYFKS